jgi:hypothetical protein
MTVEGSPMVGQFWPVPIVKPEDEWSEFDRDYVSFMQTAYSEGYRPRTESADCALTVGDSQNGRSAFLVLRGRRNGWELFLSDLQNSVRIGPYFNLPEYACVCVRPPFRDAAHIALSWMRRKSLESILGDFEYVGGYPAGIRRRRELLLTNPTDTASV